MCWVMHTRREDDAPSAPHTESDGHAAEVAMVEPVLRAFTYSG